MRPLETIGRATLLVVLAALVTPLGAPRAEARETSAEAQLDFGVKMARRGLWSEALFRFEQAAELAPGSPRVLNNLAVAYEATGRFEKALDAYQRALERDPGNRELKENYSRFVEFYQSFKARRLEGEKQGGDPEGEAPSSDSEGEG